LKLLRPNRDLLRRALLGAARRLTAAAGAWAPAAAPEAPPAAAIRRQLGFPACRRALLGAAAGGADVLRPADATRPQDVVAPARRTAAAGGSAEPGPAALFAGRTGACVVSVCTRNYLYLARTAIAAFRQHHPEMPAFLGVVDWDGQEPLAIAGTTLLACGRPEIGGDSFDYMALKYSALDLCGAIKPYVIDHVLRTTRCAKIVFIDADVLTCAPMTRLLAELDDHDFVVTPHTLAPPPNPERFWERPTLGDVAFAGPLNSGLFALRASAAAQAFLHVWRDLVTVPGAFMPELGGQTEQNAFNWVTSFVDEVRVVRDAAYNVAYWNLHDRSLRWAGLDDPGREGAWTVDGRPLVAFHFSGYSLADPLTLSRHDHRHSLYTLPSVAPLVELYGERLREHGAAEDLRRPYRFDAFPSGIAVDERMRRLFKHHETLLRSDLSPWTAAGEAHYCEAILSPIAYSGSLLPALFDAIYQERADVRRKYPNARLQPAAFHRWIAQHGIYEHDYQEIYDRHRPVLPSRHGVVALAKARQERPRLFAGLASPLGADRHLLLARLDAAGLTALAATVRTGEVEHFYVSPIAQVRRLVEERADVRKAFPDLLFGDAAAFGRWLATIAGRDHCLPDGAAAAFAACTEGRSLARIFSFLDRTRQLMDRWPLGLVGEGRLELAENLLAALRHGLEYDLDDVLMYLWTMDEQPWAGIALTFELAANARRTPSPLLEEGQEALLAPLLRRDRRFRAALARYRRDHRTPLDRRVEAHVRRSGRPRGAADSVFDVLAAASGGAGTAGTAADATTSRDAGAPGLATAGGRGGEAASPTQPASPGAPGQPRLLAQPAGAERREGAADRRPWFPLGSLPDCRGVNLFGYHKSPIGLGSLTRGLDLALGLAGVRVQRNVLGDAAMAADLEMADFVRAYDHRLDTNLFVSYPHHHDMLLARHPEHITRGRRNVVYLAWEQRDGSRYWPEVYRDFDRIWALSDFAAASLRRFLRREVATVPCVLDCDALPAPGAKRDFGLEPAKLTFAYVFDANSSIERKNPEAVIQAFARAFPRQDDVCLVLRIANGHRLHHRARLQRLLAAAPRGLDLRLATAPLARHDLLRLLSAADCYVSLHRAEGFGYTCAEAMAYGLPVVATGYSGNLQFMDRDSSLLVEYRETAVTVADGPYQRGSVWAEPDVDHAATLMRWVYDRPGEAREIGARGRQRVRRTLAPAVVGRTALAALGWPAEQFEADAAEAAASLTGALRATLEMT
jgi:glycosyltransferase involved in cell wall biosynthesis